MGSREGLQGFNARLQWRRSGPVQDERNEHRSAQNVCHVRIVGSGVETA